MVARTSGFGFSYAELLEDGRLVSCRGGRGLRQRDAYDDVRTEEASPAEAIALDYDKRLGAMFAWMVVFEKGGKPGCPRILTWWVQFRRLCSSAVLVITRSDRPVVAGSQAITSTAATENSGGSHWLAGRREVDQAKLGACREEIWRSRAPGGLALSMRKPERDGARRVGGLPPV
ncbi:hypothetical protein GLOTRDRAFT_127425 [Gloeophyllum trabeum ATCC 11539]|uniref:Uncharacterized protein n=1 Tax=Gloeophyllum trabeum (strain ATCC 11539 / FP-39264 / Madison 617) TaxID=670483 RepID=S7QCE6_GLOTA|nr:uncharacterized protein GLOTRDRAFT_127425 [Gloeophyllum trabeum ATCC 11539]EPQ57048.1 hypothetical protein GLOTRDRAFT_127425 [Gloeophyllum trabeum ATCC 11539]